MNQQQRAYLINQVERRYRKLRDELEKQFQDVPSMEKYVVRALVRGELKIQPTEVLMANLEARVDDKNFNKLLETRGYYKYRYSKMEENDDIIEFKAMDFFVLPDDFVKAYDEVQEHNGEVQAKIDELNAQERQLVLRLNLASPKTLDNLIGEVDGMGELSLFENAMSLLEPTNEPKKLK